MKKLVTVLGLISLLAFVGSAGAEDVKEKRYVPATSDAEAAVIKEAAILGKENPQVVIDRLNSYCKEHPDCSPSIDFALGELYYRIMDRGAAIQWMSRAIDKNPDFVTAHRMLGFIYLQQEKWELAINELNHLLTSPDEAKDARTYGVMGMCYLRMDDFDKAEELYKTAVDLDPENPDWYKGLAQVYIDRKEVEGEGYVAVLKKLIVLDPENADQFRGWLEDRWSVYEEVEEKE